MDKWINGPTDRREFIGSSARQDSKKKKKKWKGIIQIYCKLKNCHKNFL